jgi:hypothetical protein
MQTGTSIMERSMVIPEQAEDRVATRSSDTVPGYLPKQM